MTVDGYAESGIQVYAYAPYTSYWYLGGQDLNLAPQ